jgi:hypothetical protein
MRTRVRVPPEAVREAVAGRWMIARGFTGPTEEIDPAQLVE